MVGKKRYQKKSRKTYSKRKKYGKRKYKRATTTSLRSGTLIADRSFTKLKYTQRIDLTPAGAATDSYVFRGNSMFDPDVAPGGAQPLGFDQWAGFYNKYRVRGSKIKIYAVATSGSHFPCKISVYPQDDSSTATGVDNAAARPNSRTSITNGYGGPSTRIKNYISTKKQLGVKSINEETSYAAVITGNPNIMWYWCISVGTLDATTNIAGLYVEVEVTYYTEFFDVVDLILS